MQRALVGAVVVAVAVCVVRLGQAEAVCTGSHITILAPTATVGGAIPVAWVVEPPCDVIETGLLLGVDPDSLAKVGQPVHGASGPYQDTLTVQENGQYWIAAYARDEAGGIIQSLPQLIIAVLVPLLDDGVHGSHGAPPFYTGTDADFLQPAGEPTFASLRAATLRDESTSNGNPPSGIGSREVVSTHRDEVRAALVGGVQAGGVRFPTDPTSLDRALDLLDANFLPAGFPRPGLYSVACGVSFPPPPFAPPSPLVAGCQADFFTLSLRSLPLVYLDEIHQPNFSTPFAPTTTLTRRSSLTYFIPRPPAGKKIESAILRLRIGGSGDFSALSLSGKRVSRFFPFSSCAQVCDGFGIWDFTAEAQALADAGGGELSLSLDRIPAVVINRGFFTNTDAFWAFSVAVNYPWSHGGPVGGALTITFAQACPRELNLGVSPSAVRPKLPSDVRPPEAMVTASVKMCPPQGGGAPASVPVTFKVKPPPSTDESGGHHHVVGRPTGTLSLPGCVVDTFDANGMGSCGTTYRSSEVSGTETIVASTTASGFTDAQAKVSVGIPGLVNLAAVQTNFFRLTGQTNTHPDNHWGTTQTTLKTQLLALDFFAQYGAKIGINDLSLSSGGLFDICATWNPSEGCTIARLDGTTTPIKNGHFRHRTGRALMSTAGRVSIQI